MATVIGVRFKKAGKVYYFDPCEVWPRPGDSVVVETARGVEFGEGFRAADLRGSGHNDAFAVENGRVVTVTNRHAGILGGITSGMPIVCRVAFKPTPSIAKEQKTVDLQTMEQIPLVVAGRHDPCIVPRAVPVVEAVTALVLADMMLEGA